jgi:hypothetical protein
MLTLYKPARNHYFRRKDRELRKMEREKKKTKKTTRTRTRTREELGNGLQG